MTVPTMAESFAERLVPEGSALIAEADAHGIAARLIGGVGIRLLLGTRFDRAFERPYRDLDLIVRGSEGRSLEALLEQRGWSPSREFNALNGARRLLFVDPNSDAQVDVFVEKFEMCHALPLASVLNRPGQTVPATELLMTKLQIVRLNAKDRNDLYALLGGCELGADDRDIDPGRLASLTARDWGLHHTFELNLKRLREGLADGVLPGRRSVMANIDALEAAMHDVPKPRSWKLRARVGERARWYTDPEEVERDGRGA